MRLTIFVALMLLSLLAPLSAAAESWIYYDIREPRNQFVLENSPPRSAWMDIAGPAEFCAANDPYICFKAEDFQFALPKNFSGTQQEWTHEGVSYKVSGRSRSYILGRQYSTYFIERDLGQHRVRFLYSREAGLIAITTVSASPGLLLILSGKCGFGASARCRKS